MNKGELEGADTNGSGVTCDNAGNLTDDGTYDYYYDHEDRLTRVSGVSGALADYTYDALGRRIQTIANSTTTRYYYDGWRVLTETNGTDVAQRDYAYGNYLDEALFMVADPTNTPTTYYFASRASCPRYQPQAPPGDNRTTLSKKHNSPVALLESDGDVAERYEYDAYGQPQFLNADFTLKATQTSGYGNPIAFTGQRLDLLDTAALPLMNYKNRTYSIPLAPTS